MARSSHRLRARITIMGALVVLAVAAVCGVNGCLYNNGCATDCGPAPPDPEPSDAGTGDR